MSERPNLLGDVLHCLTLSKAAAAVDSALMTVAQLCVDSTLQQQLTEKGVLARTIPLLFLYDPTHDSHTYDAAHLGYPFDQLEDEPNEAMQ